MNTLVILVGNVGTGKSTFCEKLKKDGRHIVCPDNYPGSLKIKQNRMIREIEQGLDINKYVVLDGNTLSARARDKLLYFSKKKGCKSIVFDFGPGNDITLTRRINSNKDLTPEEWTSIHERNQYEYEKPDLKEGFDRIVRKKCY